MFKTEGGEENELAVSIGETKSKTFEVGDGIQDGADHKKSNVPGLSVEEQNKIKVWANEYRDVWLAKMSYLPWTFVYRRHLRTQRLWMRCSVSRTCLNLARFLVISGKAVPRQKQSKKTKSRTL